MADPIDDQVAIDALAKLASPTGVLQMVSGQGPPWRQGYVGAQPYLDTDAQRIYIRIADDWRVVKANYDAQGRLQLAPVESEAPIPEPDPDPFVTWVIYEHPSDFPASYVVRRWRVSARGTEADEEPTAIVASLEEARQAIPEGLVCLGPMPEDDPGIAEVWI